MSDNTFSAILSKPVGSGEKPKPYPVGSYSARITKFEFAKSKRKETPYVRYGIRLEQALADVPQDQLAGVDLSRRELHVDFYLTEDAQHRLDTFLIEHAGIVGGGRALAQTIPEAVNRTIVVMVGQTPSQKPGDNTIYNEITSTAKAV